MLLRRMFLVQVMTMTQHWCQTQTSYKWSIFLYFQHDNDKLDDEELLLFLPIHLHDGLPHFLYYSFNIFQLQDDECEVEFSFKKEDIFRLAAV